MPDVRQTGEILPLTRRPPSRQELLRMAAELLRMAAELEGQPAGEEHSVPERVTLQQIAGWVHRSKRSLEYYRSRSKTRMPSPAVQGEGGRPSLWDWSEVRPWLESVFHLKLPEHVPQAARIR